MTSKNESSKLCDGNISVRDNEIGWVCVLLSFVGRHTTVCSNWLTSIAVREV